MPPRVAKIFFSDIQSVTLNYHTPRHKKDKMAYTVPRFDPNIHFFGKEKNNEEGKIDVISWRRNISFMCKCGEEKNGQ